MNPPDFGAGGAAYRAFRPSYPDALYDAVLAAVGPPRGRALDLGAGTGIAAARLAQYFREVIAAEPDGRMIAAGSFPANVRVVQAPAEELNFPDDHFALIACGNAFYWMDGDALIPRIHRWLAPGGVFAAWRYNMPATDHPAVDAILAAEDAAHWDEFRHGRLRDTGYTGRCVHGGPFSTVERKRVGNTVPLTPARLTGFFASTSYGGAHLRTLPDPDAYCADLTARIEAHAQSLAADFSLELILAHK